MSIVVRHVSRSYVVGAETVKAVDDVNLSVGRGEFACIVGASGSGKTTLLNLVAGLDRPDAGSIEVNGKELVGRAEAELTAFRLTDVGVVFQDHNLIEEFTALENVMLPLEVAGVAGGEARPKAERELAAVGLDGLGGRFPRELSGGQGQRVGIARAMIGDRQLLLADEPTGALDSGNSQALFETLRDLCAGGRSVLLVTHDPLAEDFADTVYQMRDGRLTRRDES